MGIAGVTLCPQAVPRSRRGCAWRSLPGQGFSVVWAWLGGGAVTQFLGGVPALLRGGSPCLGPGELLEEEYEKEK